MKYKNPFKIIQQQDIERFNLISPDTPTFMNSDNGTKYTQYNNGTSNSPQFPSFG